ncbi:PREDICTED: F-box/kelch-repeat protein At3g23880-like [Ipomoea nil]|uniref:F-box/kelch-repeat protein At3g23880-like n=1 Tax=Ipomoea nil TaxID=35883 RepID=UPI000900F3B5|nr:PREDICTED: F-box/kelch-repeat protein At3g23880-like [Ipomoea nil]
MEVSAAKKARSPPPHIPMEMILYILLKMEIKAVIRCECVCKEWRSTIEDPDFKLSYRGGRQVLVAAASGSKLAFTTITTETLRIKTLFYRWRRGKGEWWSGVWCSCNGLVLFSMKHHILLWNPSTRRCTKVLELRRLEPSWWHGQNVVSASGLCYVPSTGDYKAVLLLRDDWTVLVASLKNKEWRSVVFPHHAVSVRDSGVNFHNTLHWRVANSARDWCSSRRCKKVVYFDAESDEFKELPTPSFPAESRAILGLGIIDGGHLCMARERRKGTGEVEVLVMKEYGVKNSWITQFVISASQFRSGYHRDFTFYPSKYNTQALIGSCLYGWWGALVYHFKNKKLETFLEAESGHKSHTAAICSYVQSFVSPHEFIWRDNDDQHNPPAQNDDALLRFILGRFNI